MWRALLLPVSSLRSSASRLLHAGSRARRQGALPHRACPLTAYDSEERCLCPELFRQFPCALFSGRDPHARYGRWRTAREAAVALDDMCDAPDEFAAMFPAVSRRQTDGWPPARGRNLVIEG